MVSTHIVGIDPGLVHTGLVRLRFTPGGGNGQGDIKVDTLVLSGMDATNSKAFAYQYASPVIFIEAYRPRSTLATDKRMVEGVAAIKKATGGKVLQNTGIKSVVKQPLLELLGAWKYMTPTHHDDLRSAARIAVLGMLKDPELNALLTLVVRSHLAGRTWDVRL